MTTEIALSPDDRFNIIDFIHRFYELVDTGRAAETALMFVGEATLTFGAGSPKPGTLFGEEIAAAMQDRQRLTQTTTRHAISNIILKPETGERVRIRYLMTLFRSDDGPRTSLPAFVADVEELVIRDLTDLKILARTVTPIFSKHQV